MPVIPWDKLTTPFPNALPHTSLWWGCLMRWQYSNKYPVSSSNAAPAISKNISNRYLWLAAFRGSIWYDVQEIWQQGNTTLSIMLKMVLWERALLAGGRDVFILGDVISIIWYERKWRSLGLQWSNNRSLTCDNHPVGFIFVILVVTVTVICRDEIGEIFISGHPRRCITHGHPRWVRFRLIAIYILSLVITLFCCIKNTC